MSTIMLVDGNSLTYRAFHALPQDLMTASGQVTNAVYGFTSMLVNLVRDHRPDLVVVAWDRPEPTFRHEQVDTYKANRREAPDILRQQLGLVREVATALRLPMVDAPGYEADDVIATLASQAAAAGDDVLVVTGDRDSYQLVSDPHVRVLYNRRGVSDYALYDEAGIEERTGVTPAQYVEYAALRGDPSDNLPGVPGVGEKTAARLIRTYGGIDGVFEHVDDQTPKLRTSLAEHEEQVRRNAEVMKLVRDVPLDQDLSTLAPGSVDQEELRKLFDFLEFHSLYERLGEALEVLGQDAGVPSGDTPTLEVAVEVWDDRARAVAGLEGLRASPSVVAVGAAWSGEPGRSDLDGLAFSDGSGPAGFVPASLLAADASVAAAVQAVVAAGGPGVAAHDMKPVMRRLLDLGIDATGLRLDTMLAAYLLDPADTRYLLDDLLSRFAGLELPDGDAVPEGQLDLGGTAADAAEVAAAPALAVAALSGPLTEALESRGLRALNDDVEVPLVRVLARMEAVGVGVDVAELESLNQSMAAECDTLTQVIWDDAGRQFNVRSTKELRDVLFDELGLVPQKKTAKGQFSTDAASLEKLVGQHPIVEHLLRFREVEKLRSTYGEGLLAEVGPDGRIHATFNQTVARTGRLSSDAPNLHNIPVRSEMGRAFRRAFVPAPGFELLVADYNQIELRCIAHLADDPGLVHAFETGADVHRTTAARVFGVPEDEVTFEQRSRAKMVSYGLAYGMQSFGLGQRLNIPTGEAQEILDAYFEAFPSVRDYMDRVVAEARDRGYTETLFGRRRQIPELSSRNRNVRMAGERQAMNAGIQGLAADIFKVALVHLDRSLDEAGVASRLILQVHDEVLVEVAPAEKEQVAALTREAMSGAFDLRVPLEVDLAFGSSWADAKG